MTTPVIATTGLTSGAAANPQSLTLPASIAAGDLLLLFIQFDTSITTMPTPSGWTSLSVAVTTGSAIFYKLADGTEGATLSYSYTNGSNQPVAAVCYRVTGSDGVTAPAFAKTNPVVTTTFDPPSLTPSWGSDTTLWLASAQEAVSTTVSTAPTSYSLQNNQSSPTPAATIHVYSRANTTATENPSAYTLSASASGIAATIGVRPAAGSVGAVSASSAVAGVGQATTNAVGSIAATGAVAGVGQATTNAVGSIAATGAVSAVGKSTANSVGLISASSGVNGITVLSLAVVSVTAAVVGVGASIASAVGAIAASGGGSGAGIGSSQAVGMVAAFANVVAAGVSTATSSGSIAAVSGLSPVPFAGFGDSERAWVTWQSNSLKVLYEEKSYRVPARTDIQERSRKNRVSVLPRLRL